MCCMLPSALRRIHGLVAVAVCLSYSPLVLAGSHGGGGGFHGGGGGFHVGGGGFHGGGGGFHGGGWGFHGGGGGFRGGGYGGGFRGAGYGRGFYGGGYGGRGWFGGNLRGLPGGYSRFWYGGSPYYCAGGFWYRPWNDWYLGCYPPVGLWMDTLPLGYDQFWDDGVHYYENQDVYYTDAPSGGYAVADPPEGHEASTHPAKPMPGSPDALALDALLIVPEKGQGAAKMKADRDNAQLYAETRSGYDPAYSDPEDPGTPRARRAYLKAMRTYLSDRGYAVK